MKNKKSFAKTHPELFKQWHPTMNGDLDPNQLVFGSGKKVWWKCNKADDHIWSNSIRNRTKRNQGCPYCNKIRPSSTYNLATEFPQSKINWDYKKNESQPEDYLPNSTKEVWWKCEQNENHKWSKKIFLAVKSNNCDICNSFGHNYPKLLRLWDEKKNKGLDPFKISKQNGLKVWWKCDKFQEHSYQMRISHKTRNLGCPQCSSHQISSTNNVVAKYPILLNYWDFEKNKEINPYELFSGSKKEVWWKCEKGDDHIWKEPISNFVARKSKCRICNGSILAESTKLKNKFPKIFGQLYFQKYDIDFVENLKFNDGRRVWWKCDKGDDHIWKTSVYHRTMNNSNCPACEGLMVVKSNSLENNYPKISSEWHNNLNGNLRPNEVVFTSAKKVWWKCDKGNDHTWKTSIHHRVKNESGCPFCTLTPQSKQELTITFELKKLFRNINPKGFKTRLGGKLRSIDIYIPSFNLCIEFDGSYWHKNRRDIDKIKSEMLLSEGFKVIRVRQEPLKKIHKTDIISKKPYNGKQVTNDILSIIMSIYDLDNKAVSKIKEYQTKEGLQNKKGLERYIDEILKEKASKSKK